MTDHRWDDDPNHPEGFDCDGYPLSSGERCGGSTHRPHPAVNRGGQPMTSTDPAYVMWREAVHARYVRDLEADLATERVVSRVLMRALKAAVRRGMDGAA